MLLELLQAGVVSLQKLLVREKAGQESRGIYLISSNPADPEMFELKVHKPKDKQMWIRAIRWDADWQLMLWPCTLTYSYVTTLFLLGQIV